jgi:PPM family protein phosphatase
VLCSDGLSGMVTDTEIADTVANEGDLDRLCARLIEMANAAGGLDNVTVVAVRIEPE